MIEKVLKGEFPPPRAADRSIPVALEAICLKAMAKVPEMRYPSVRELAQDLEHWLADEPVAAYPERRLERLGRWLRQHRTWTYAAAAALVGISLVASVAVVVIEGARRSEEGARKEAETNFKLAQGAVEDYLTNVSENTLLKEQDSVDMRTLRQDLLRSALEYYQRFVDQRRNDPLLRQQLAKAYFSVGQITQEIGSQQQAIDAFRRALGLWEPLVTADPENHELKGHLADCHLAIGKLQIAAGNLEAAMNSLAQARAILELLMAGNTRGARYQSSLADCYKQIAIVHADLEQSSQSLAILEKAKVIQKGLIQQYPDKLPYERSLAEIINVLGFAYFTELNNAAALDSFREVQRICLSILKRYTVGPKPAWALNLLALSQYNIGIIHTRNGESEQALRSYEESLGYRSLLADSHPSVTEYQEKLGMSLLQIADLEHEAHQDDKAFRSIRRSVEVFEGLVRAQPDQANYHSELGLSWNFLGHLYDEARNNSDAIRPFNQAIIEQRLAVSKSNDAEEYRKYLCNHLEDLGEQSVDLGRVEEGLPLYEEALKYRRELSAAHPESREYSLELVKALVALGNIQRHDGKSAAARALFTEARTILEGWVSTSRGDAALQGRLAAVLDHEAVTLADQGVLEQAKQLLGRSVALFRSGAERTISTTDGLEERGWHSEALWDLARVLRGLNRPEEAQPADAEREALWKDRPADELVMLALKQTTRASLIGYGKTPISAPAQAVRQLDLDQAAANLCLAVTRGFKDLRFLQSHPDSAILLARGDLKSLIKGLEAPGLPIHAQPPK